MPKPLFYDTTPHPKTLIVGVGAPYNKTKYLDSYFDELKSLVKTAGIPYDHELFLKIREIDKAYFFTKGKLEQIKQICQENTIELVIISDQLTPQQARNLEDFLDVEIFDRTDLILDIFEQAAISAEGKMQVAIAKLEHQKTRLAGKGIWLEQQAGSKGVRSGPGETAKEKERRHIEEQVQRNKKQLKQLQKTRETQRKQRLGRNIPHICLVGYTNAGKSTILNALTKSNVLAEDKLFATLDTTTRALFINGKQKGILSDTVGFIQQLPHRLVDAFKSTLSELQYADLLIQIIDLSDPNWESHTKIVHEILEDLEVDKPMLYAFNKTDKVADLASLQETLDRYQPHVIISATSKNGLQPLIAFLDGWDKK